MPRGPKVNKEIERAIMEIVSHSPEMQASQIEDVLIKRFVNLGIPIPSLRTIQLRAKSIREYMNIQDKPWSIAAMMQDEEKTIPWEALEFIMQSYIVIEDMIKSGEKTLPQIWRYRSDYIGEIFKSIGDIDPDKAGRVPEVDPKTPLMTYRQAKWLWRIHLMLPGLKPKDLFWHVDAYVQRELLKDYYGWEIDTSDLDSALMTIQRNVLEFGYYADRGDTDEGAH